MCWRLPTCPTTPTTPCGDVRQRGVRSRGRGVRAPLRHRGDRRVRLHRGRHRHLLAPGAPPGSLGRLPEGVAILDPETGDPCPPAEFDAAGRVVNAEAATGELVNVAGSGAFAGYYNNPEADAERIRDGRYWSGDLAYRDAEGFVYFAGRSSGWLRVDGENLGSAPIERILLRYDGFAQVTVYGVPDVEVGDRVMAAVVPTREFDPVAFADFLDAQSDLGPKQRPSLIRVCVEFPRTATFKVLTRALSAEATQCADPVWVRDGDRYSPR